MQTHEFTELTAAMNTFVSTLGGIVDKAVKLSETTKSAEPVVAMEPEALHKIINDQVHAIFDNKPKTRGFVDAVNEVIETDAIADAINYQKLSDKVDIEELAQCFNDDDVAAYIDVEDVAGHIDLDDVAKEIDIEDLAKALVKHVDSEAMINIAESLDHDEIARLIAHKHKDFIADMVKQHIHGELRAIADRFVSVLRELKLT